MRNIYFDYELQTVFSEHITDHIRDICPFESTCDPIIQAMRCFHVNRIRYNPDAMSIYGAPAVLLQLGKKRQDQFIEYEIAIQGRNRYQQQILDFSSNRPFELGDQLEPLERSFIAHELGHLYLRRYIDFYRHTCSENNTLFDHNVVELICNLYAFWLLMPHRKLTGTFSEYLSSTKHPHPLNALMYLRKSFRLPIRTVLLHSINCGLFRKKPWIIGLFRFRSSPKKPNKMKWRLIPRFMCLPDGISSSKTTRKSNDKVQFYSDHGHYYAGLDTLQLSYPEWAKIPYQQALIEKYSHIETSDNHPWSDLNKLMNDKRRLCKNSIHFSTNLSTTELSDIFLDVFNMDFDRLNRRFINIRYRLSANQIKLTQYNSFGVNYLLFCATLQVSRRDI